MIAIEVMLLAISILSNLGERPSRISPRIFAYPSSKRGYSMGIPPTPAFGQSFAEAYAQAYEYTEFEPIQGQPPPSYGMESGLSGSSRDSYVRGYTRGNGTFPLVQFFFDTGMILVKPPGMDDATLSDPAWRETYKDATLYAVRAAPRSGCSMTAVQGSLSLHHTVCSQDYWPEADHETTVETLKPWRLIMRGYITSSRLPDSNVFVRLDVPTNWTTRTLVRVLGWSVSVVYPTHDGAPFYSDELVF